ncbi:MAG: anaerobic ribonucleoside-triphosphate reductase activating protein [Candidatus Omnitrophica bacterium]|nr:anaerobic ribonucleoside-triphosphate reductase activating protein [Candidatus Omnitrophota bacterium]
MKGLWKKFNIKGFKEASLLEWYGKLASVLFLGNCNFRCPFCHARSLVLESDKLENVPFEKIAGYLTAKKAWIDGVAITGGEIFLHEWLGDLIDEIKKLSFPVMIETNGSFPGKIKALLDKKIIDYISMDIKSPLEKYKLATGVDVNTNDIQKSINIIMSSGVDYEFRTTVVPQIIDKQDIAQIAGLIRGAKRLCLQQFFPVDTIDAAYMKVKPYPKEILTDMAKEAGKLVDIVEIKNI